MFILITGGLGFIGSITASYLAINGYQNIVILDNLHNSNIKIYYQLKNLHPETNFIFYEGDIRDGFKLKEIFENHKINTVIHMAALKSVKESFEKSIDYYDVNVLGTINLLNYMKQYNVKKLIFSSSATVYGSSSPPLTESSQTGIGITNPYGKTKYMIENILLDSKDFDIVILRYFNPIGAHKNQLLGENPNNYPNNIFPCILGATYGKLPAITIFGTDYNTLDGTCIRDYIDINDLAEAHVASVKYLENNNGIDIFNIGTGFGTSVFELINTFENSNNIKVPYIFGNRRDGDLDCIYASINTETFEKLQWFPKYDLVDSCINGWNFYKKCQMS